jgi:hypothetical protein
VTSNLLLYAHRTPNVELKVALLEGLADVFLDMKRGFQPHNKYRVNHLPRYAGGVLALEGKLEVTRATGSADSPPSLFVTSALRTIKPTRYWNEVPRDKHPIDPVTELPDLDRLVPEGNATGENILSSSQYMYAVARLIRATAEMPRATRSAKLTAFVASYLTLVMDDHYKRWVLGRPDEVGLFNVQYPWMCGLGKFSHAQYLRHVKDNKFKTTKSYCSLITDTDWWIAAGVAEMLLARRRDPVLVAFDDPDSQLSKYVLTAATVFKSRTQPTSIGVGGAEIGRTFGAGEWDHHKDYDYAGYEGTAIPSSTSHGTGVSWDIRHARRWIHVFDTFTTFTNIYGAVATPKVVWPTEADSIAFATQFAIKVPTAVANADGVKCLKFRNFMNGSNGWYRYTVGMKTPLASAGPFSRSDDGVLGGYGFWSSSDPRIGPYVRRWVTEHGAQMKSAAWQLEILPSLVGTAPYPAVVGGCQVPAP